MAFEAKDGRKFSMSSRMRAHNRSLGDQEKPEGTVLDAPGEDEGGEMEPHHEQIHDHLRQMHEQTGGAHSHVEHHGDGGYTSHHVDENGEVSGPHRHASAEELVDHLKTHLPEEEQEIAEGDEEE